MRELYHHSWDSKKTPTSTLLPEDIFYQSLGYLGVSSIAHFLLHFRVLHSERGVEAAHLYTSSLDSLYTQADGLHSQLLLTRHGEASEKFSIRTAVETTF